MESFHDDLAVARIHRAYVVRRGDQLLASHPDELAHFVELLRQSPGYAEHEAVFIGRQEGVPTLFFAFVHGTRRGLAQGGLRFHRYGALDDLVFDGLRLSQGMTRKNALAGLWWGGGKAVMPITRQLEAPEYHHPEGSARPGVFQAFGRFVASLNGIYYAAEDVGTYTPDMDAILSVNRFVTCVSSEFGGSGNPSPHTAAGVFTALKAALEVLDGTADLQGRIVSVQGAGNVGWPFLEALHQAGAILRVTDTSPNALERVRALGDRHQTLADPEAIYDTEAEIFAPCAVGASVNEKTIPRLKRSGVRLICGAANNILATAEDADRLVAHGILFVPDFVCNRLGIVNCANEPFGYLEEDIDRAVQGVAPDTRAILERAQQSGRTPLAEANLLADRAARELHPIWGHRGARLTDQLMRSDWSST